MIRTKPSPTTSIWALVCVLLLVSPLIAAEDGATLRGTVTALGANHETLKVPGALLKLTSTASGSAGLTAVTDDQGEYKFTNLSPGLYRLEISAPGFASQTRRLTIRPSDTTVEEVRLEIETVRTTVTVNTQSEGIQAKEATPALTIGQRTLQSVPLVNERFQDALPLIPGVVRGPDGLLNVKGARASQSGLTVNSANVTDPVTGEFAINLPIEAIQSVEVLTNPYAPEYGQLTGAITKVETRSGSEKFNVQGDSFFPRFRRRDGSFVGVEAFTPRVAFSGPLFN